MALFTIESFILSETRILLFLRFFFSFVIIFIILGT